MDVPVSLWRNIVDTFNYLIKRILKSQVLAMILIHNVKYLKEVTLA